MKWKFLAITSVFSLMLLSWALDTFLQPHHCINSNTVSYFVQIAPKAKLEYSLANGHYKGLKRTTIPSCNVNPYFKFSSLGEEYKYQKYTRALEQLEDLATVLIPVKNKIQIVIRQDQKNTVELSPTKVELGLDVASERNIQQAVLEAWMGQSYKGLDAFYISLFSEFLITVIRGEYSDKTVPSGDISKGYLMLTGTGLSDHCESQTVSLRLLPLCKNPILSKVILNKLRRGSVATDVLKAYLVKFMWQAFEQLSLKQKTEALSVFKSKSLLDYFNKPLPPTIKQAQVNYFYNKNLEALTNLLSLRHTFKPLLMASKNKVDVLIKDLNPLSFASEYKSLFSESENNKSKNFLLFKGRNIYGSNSTLKSLEFNKIKAKNLVIVSCLEPVASEVVKYAYQSSRLLYIKSCDKVRDIKWSNLFKRNPEAFFAENKGLIFYYFHLPSLKVALKYGDLKPKDNDWSQLLGWGGQAVDPKTNLIRPKGVIDAITVFRSSPIEGSI